MGLSSQTGTLTLKVPGTSPSPSASFENTHDTQSPGQTFPVQVTTLDRYFADKSARKIRLIKCDAEGHELEVFRGARQILTTHHPHLLFECEIRHLQSGSVTEVFDFLTVRIEFRMNSCGKSDNRNQQIVEFVGCSSCQGP